MFAIDGDLLLGLAPPMSGGRAERQRQIIDGMGGRLAATLARFEIDTPLRAAHFLAQVAHESDGFCTTEEYADGRAYEGRRDLGNDQPGDGPRFKGRGLIQVTGRANYLAIGTELGVDLVADPMSVCDPCRYLEVSCVFWRQKGINAYSDRDDLISVTKIVNGGLNGLDSRRDYLAKAKTLVAGAVGAASPEPAGGEPILHRGCQGDAVADLQRQLAAVGYAGAIDGDFGPAMDALVKRFQSDHGLTADGVVGAATWASIHPPPKAAASQASGGT